MKVKFLGRIGEWSYVLDSARTTMGKESLEKEPASSWKRRMLLAEHSPIRQILFRCKIFDLKSWVSVHICRHKQGIEHWVKSNRDDRNNRTGIIRDELPQSTYVEHEFLASSQAMINVSRKRLCNCASIETRETWQAVLLAVKETEPEVVSACVKDCIYRGWCYEFYSCGYHKTESFLKELAEYRQGINE